MGAWNVSDATGSPARRATPRLAAPLTQLSREVPVRDTSRTNTLPYK
jgi:hypothetical protein